MKVVAVTPLNFTDVVVKPVPLKLVPVMTTCFPMGANVGEKDVMVGAGAKVTVKFVALVPVPLGVVTRIAPVVAPVGTVTVIWVAEFTVNLVVATLVNETAVAPVKFVPVMTTEAPTGPISERTT